MTPDSWRLANEKPVYIDKRIEELHDMRDSTGTQAHACPAGILAKSQAEAAGVTPTFAIPRRRVPTRRRRRGSSERCRFGALQNKRRWKQVVVQFCTSSILWTKIDIGSRPRPPHRRD
ncbi:hypothetical protein DL768_000037 [Monosporascus sp. mg162]|nr:hypothetical protein DL768_000037 [Monosporascus sp. mg162]